MAKFISGLKRDFELRNGGFIEFEIGINDVREKFLREQNLSVPEPVKIKGLIDTGATASCIDIKYQDKLRLEPQGYATCTVAGARRYPLVFNISIAIPLENAQWKSGYHPCAAFNNLGADGVDALIGLDILRNFHFLLDGPNSHFQLLLPEVNENPPLDLPTMDGEAYFDPQDGCFLRWQNGEWQKYHPPKPAKPGVVSWLKRRFS